MILQELLTIVFQDLGRKMPNSQKRNIASSRADHPKALKGVTEVVCPLLVSSFRPPMETSPPRALDEKLLVLEVKNDQVLVTARGAT